MIGALVAGITGSAGVLNSFESIATATGTGSSATITFSSIPSGFKHLQIRGISRNAGTSGNYESTLLRFNSDSGNNYSAHYLIGNGSSASAYAWTNESGGYGSFTTTANAITSTMAAYVIDILDYTNTNKYKTTRILNGFDNNGTGASSFNQGIVGISSSLWLNTAAITSISIVTNSNWTTSTTFALYGIKEA